MWNIILASMWSCTINFRSVWISNLIPSQHMQFLFTMLQNSVSLYLPREAQKDTLSPIKWSLSYSHNHKIRSSLPVFEPLHNCTFAPFSALSLQLWGLKIQTLPTQEKITNYMFVIPTQNHSPFSHNFSSPI